MPDPVVLITGASRGLGRSMALHLARAGVNVIGTYRERAEEAAATVRAVEAHGRRAVMLPLDVARSETFTTFAEDVRRVLRDTFARGTFDYLVNNAGHALHAPIAETSPAAFDAIVAVHLKGPYFLTQALLPLIGDGGRIVNVSSGLARFSYPGYAAYGAAKGAVEVLTRYMAQEFARRGITVNTVAPGAIATDFGGGAVRDIPAVNQQVAAAIALGRAGEADDVGAAVAALLSDAMRWVNGTRLEVSGGQNL